MFHLLFYLMCFISCVSSCLFFVSVCEFLFPQSTPRILLDGPADVHQLVKWHDADASGLYRGPEDDEWAARFARE